MSLISAGSISLDSTFKKLYENLSKMQGSKIMIFLSDRAFFALGIAYPPSSAVNGHLLVCLLFVTGRGFVCIS